MNYGPSRHGSAEQVPRGRFQASSTVFGITPPGSRSGTPPRSSTRPARSTSRRRSRDDFSESRERARSREERRREQQVGGASDEQPLPTGWGARMLAAERKLATQEDQLKNLTAIVEAANATLTQRILFHEKKTVEHEGWLNDMETTMPERVFKTEERQALYVTMINDFKSTSNNKLLSIDTTYSHVRDTDRKF